MYTYSHSRRTMVAMLHQRMVIVYMIDFTLFCFYVYVLILFVSLLVLTL
jgi:hypothetical protein